MYVAVVSPSAAVTVTTKLFSPGSNSVPPTTFTSASASAGVTTTSTSVVPYSRATLSPSATSAPFTWNAESSTLLPAGRFKVTT